MKIFFHLNYTILIPYPYVHCSVFIELTRCQYLEKSQVHSARGSEFWNLNRKWQTDAQPTASSKLAILRILTSNRFANWGLEDMKWTTFSLAVFLWLVLFTFDASITMYQFIRNIHCVRSLVHFFLRLCSEQVCYITYDVWELILYFVRFSTDSAHSTPTIANALENSIGAASSIDTSNQIILRAKHKTCKVIHWWWTQSSFYSLKSENKIPYRNTGQRWVNLKTLLALDLKI